MIRRRNSTLKKVKELDMFHKISQPYIKQSAVGGTFSLITFCIIIYLIYGETLYFLDSKLQFHFQPDIDMDEKLKINIDITVAMPCNHLGADFIDSTRENMLNYEPLKEEDSWWLLTPDQRSYFDTIKHLNSYFSEEYHAIHELLWKSNKDTYYGQPPERKYTYHYPSDACRIHGSLYVNKVAGNFHIVSGKLLNLPRNHIHISTSMSSQNYNFSHRINKFSFGDPTPGIIHPLEGDEKFSDNHMTSFQYFIDIVPTDINLFLRKRKTNQYSVKDFQQILNHEKGTHGIPGIFFHYDTSSLKVIVTQKRDSVVQFLVKLCATIGGIYVTNGLINMMCQTCIEFIKNKYFFKPETKSTILQSQNEAEKSLYLANVPSTFNVVLNKS